MFNLRAKVGSESGNRALARLLIFSIGCNALVFVGALVYATLPTATAADSTQLDEVKTRKLLVVDDAGRTRIGLTDQGLLIADKNSVVRFSIVFAENGEDMMAAISDHRGKARIMLQTTPSGGGTIDIYNNTTTKVVTLQANKFNCGMVAVSDATGEMKQSLVALP